MKREELYRTKYRSERELKDAIADYITFYNEKRPHARNHQKHQMQPNKYILIKIPRFKGFRNVVFFCLQIEFAILQNLHSDNKSGKSRKTA